MVKLKLLLLLTYSGVVSLASAQEITPLSHKDSVDYLVALADKKIESSPREAERLIRRAHTLAVEAKYAIGEGKALFVLGKVFRGLNKSEESIDTYLKAARLFESLLDSSRAGRAYNAAAGMYLFKMLNYTNAYQYCNKAIALLQHDTVYLPNALSNLAALYLQTGKLDDALKLYKENYEANRKRNYLLGMCVALNNIATVYDYKHDFKLSIAYYVKAIEISRAIGDYAQTAHILLGLAPAYCQLKDHKRSKLALDESLALSEKHSLFEKQVFALQALSMESEHLGKLDDARNYSLRAKKIVEQQNFNFLKGSIYKQLSCIYKKDNPALALQYEQKYSRFQDSLATQEKLALASLKLDEKDSTAPAENNDSPNFSGGWMIALSMVILIPGMFFIFYKKRREKVGLPARGSASALLQPEQLSTDEEPVTALDNEAHHDVPETIQHLEVINGEGIKLLPLNNIWWFQKEGKNYHAFTETGNYRVRQNITELEQALPRNQFFRVNRAVIINTEQMSNYSFWENHKYIIRMKDAKKSEFIISRNRLREMKETFQVMESASSASSR